MFRRLFAMIVLLAFSPAARIGAQAIVLKDGSRLAAGDFTVGDGKISRTVTLSGGQKGQSSVPFSDIAQMDWSNPKELVDARNLMAAGKLNEAVATLQKGKNFFHQFRDIKGSPYDEILFALVEALEQTGDFDSIIKVMPELNAIKWDDDKKTALRIIKLNMERRTSQDQEKVLMEAESLRDATDDAAARAKLSMTIGDIHFKKEHWDEAFDAYLRVPVFYGRQTLVVPQAELMAARCLVKLERYKDASDMFDRIALNYPGSEVGAAAKKEFLASTGRENKPDKPPQSSKESPKKTEKKAKS